VYCGIPSNVEVKLIESSSRAGGNTIKSQQAIESSSSAVPSHLVVKAEKLFEQMKEFSQSITQRACEFFKTRGREFGHNLEDWFQVESEFLRRVPVEIKESDSQLIEHAEAPGFSASESKVSVEPCCLMISGNTEAQTESPTERTIFTERHRFCHRLKLPAEVDPAQVRATLKDGIPELTLARIAIKRADEHRDQSCLNQHAAEFF
jgi:HSP20 family molecular chaperone IbpA